jgi:hypothetical protein
VQLFNFKNLEPVLQDAFVAALGIADKDDGLVAVV